MERTPDSVFRHPMKAAVDNAQRISYMDTCMRFGWKELGYAPAHGGVMQVVCYGPSLKKTWEKIDPALPIITVSGARGFLVERGIVPTYHADMDPREHKLQFLRNPHPRTKYLMASCCHPMSWALLCGLDVRVFHVWNGHQIERWCDMKGQRQAMIYTGSHVGGCAIRLSQRMGYRKFIVHGMDMSFETNATHAGGHGGPVHKQEVEFVNDVPFVTSKISINMADEMLHWLKTDPIDATFHGDGMMQELVKSHRLPNARVV